MTDKVKPELDKPILPDILIIADNSWHFRWCWSEFSSFTATVNSFSPVWFAASSSRFSNHHRGRPPFFSKRKKLDEITRGTWLTQAFKIMFNLKQDIHQNGWCPYNPRNLFDVNKDSIDKWTAQMTMQDCYVITIWEMFCLHVESWCCRHRGNLCLGFQLFPTDFNKDRY